MRKKSKRIFSLLVSMLFVMQLGINPVITYADVNNEDAEKTNYNESTDSQEIEVKNIYFNKNEFKVGETLEIFADIENVSEENTIYAFLWAPQTPLYYKLSYNEELGLYTASVEIEESFVYKTLNLVGIEIHNSNGNVTQHESDLSITVTDENGLMDEEAPVINSVKVNKEELKVGEKLEVLVEATDDVAGIEKITGSLYVNQEPRELKFSYDEANKVYKSYLEITEDLKYKRLSINSIVARDKTGKDTYSSDRIEVSILDKDGNRDTTKPVINSVQFDKEYYKVGDTAKLYIDAQDNESGIRLIEAYVKVGRYTERLFPEYDEELKKYVDEIYIKENMVASKISLANLMISDNSYNYARFEENVSAYVLTNDGQLDKQAPVISSIEYDKDKIILGDRLEITLDATDDISGINQVNAKYNIGKSSYTKMFSKYDSNSNKYTLRIYPDEFNYFKNLNIEYIEAIDNAGNVTKIEVNKKIPMTDESGIIDEEAPIINSVKFSKSKVKPGEKLELYIDATDKGLGISDVYVMLNIGEHWDEYNLRYDEKLGIYKVSFDITEDMLGSEVKIYNLAVTDRGNNRHSETPSITCIVDKNGEISPEEPSKPGEPSTPKVPVINEGTDIKEVIEEIKASEEKEIKVEVNNKEKIVDKEVFKAIAGTDKNISFTQEDGTVWTFSGKDIKTDKLDSVKLSVSNIPTKEAKVEIEKLTDDAVFIKFDHHGVLPGKASVKVQVDKKKDLVGKKLTFYYYNEETKKIEKISDNVTVDENGYVILEIDHCSDYFLSEKSDLAYVGEDENKSPVEEGKEENSKPSTGVDKDDNQKQNDVIGNTNSNEKNEAINNSSQEVLPKTGSVISSNILVVVSILMVATGLIFYRKRKATN